MKNISFLLLCSLLYYSAASQDIIISGQKGNRPLRWDDFTGKPDYQSSFEANTWWNLKYGFKGISFKGDTVLLQGMSITLELSPQQSWIKKGSETDALLRHEQGHFDIGRLCAAALKKAFDTAYISSSSYKTKPAEIFKAVLQLYHDMGLQYDKETDHSKNKAEQQRWEALLAEKLKGL